MAQPLLAGFRITVSYVVMGFTHKWRGYCDVDDYTDPLPKLVGRAADLTDWDDCAQGFWDAAINIMGPSVSGASALLERYSAPLWLPVDAVSLIGDGLAAPDTAAAQYTLVLRDTAFKFIRDIIMEPGLGLYVGHSVNGDGINGSIDAFNEGWNGDDADLTAPYNWQKSRGDRYILGSGMVAGGTLDLNDKMKRARGLE